MQVMIIPERRIETQTGKRIHGRQARRFLKGPIPIPWMQTAMRLRGGSPFKLGMVLWYRAGLTRSRTIKLSKPVLDSFGMSRRTAHHALNALERVGLVAVTRQRGKAPLVAIVVADDWRR